MSRTVFAVHASFCDTETAAASNYMRAQQIEATSILRPMPGPWGKAIEALRVEKGITREAAAKKARMTPTSYGKIEKGGHTFTSKLRDIADAFGVPIEEVLDVRLSPKLGVPASVDLRSLQTQIAELQRQVVELQTGRRPSATSERTASRGSNRAGIEAAIDNLEHSITKAEVSRTSHPKKPSRAIDQKKKHHKRS